MDLSISPSFLVLDEKKLSALGCSAQRLTKRRAPGTCPFFFFSLLRGEALGGELTVQEEKNHYQTAPAALPDSFREKTKSGGLPPGRRKSADGVCGLLRPVRCYLF